MLSQFSRQNVPQPWSGDPKTSIAEPRLLIIINAAKLEDDNLQVFQPSKETFERLQKKHPLTSADMAYLIITANTALLVSKARRFGALSCPSHPDRQAVQTVCARST